MSESYRRQVIVTILSSLTIIVALILVLDLWPAVRGGFGWRWPYLPLRVSALAQALPGLTVLFIYLVGLYWFKKGPLVVNLGWSILGATSLPVAMLLWWGNPLEILFTRTISGLATGAFTVGTGIDDLLVALRHWPELMVGFHRFSSHMAISPPGWAIIYYGLAHFLEHLPAVSEPMGMALRTMQCHDVPLMELSNAQLATAWFGIASPFWTALAVLPLYGLVRQLGHENVAREAVIWWPLVPALALFVGTLSTPYALIATAVVYLTVCGLTASFLARRRLLMVLAGLLTGVSILINFSLVPLLLFCGLLTLLLTLFLQETTSYSSKFWQAVQAGFYFGLGLLLVLGLYTWVAGPNLFEVYQTGMSIHLELERPYVPWLFLHIWDFAFFLGLPFFGLLVWSSTRWRQQPLHLISLALLLTLLILALSGTGRGETGRVWIFFMPLALVGVAAIFQELTRRQRVMLIGCQAGWFVSLWLFLLTVGTGLHPPPAYAEVAYLPAAGMVEVPVVEFGEVMQLHGYLATYQPERNSLQLDLYWQIKGQIETPYFFSALLVTPDGEIKTAVDWQPFDYQFPTTCWHTVTNDTLLMDRIEIPLADPSPPGDWWLSLAVFAYSETVYERLPTITAAGIDDQIGLGPIRIQP
jgi:hypothetical protein